MKASGRDWAILGVSLQTPTMRDARAPQGFVYHAVEQGPAGAALRRVKVVRSVLVATDDPEAGTGVAGVRITRSVLVAKDDPEAVLFAMTDPAVRMSA
ncbi:hypothetical protein SAMN05878503_11729 [Cereibacter ovatus]|uniref:Uncharacterized protein n=2 Tax=Cereibacter ovatus TaxID=439529 RepID=A0A285D1Z4_9RHOB|nr:hypothetical protein SAMN05878503_11729 [Cereibacter ovatus]